LVVRAVLHAKTKIFRKKSKTTELISHFSVILLFLQNIPYGRNDCTLDLYHPNVPRPEGGYMSMPVVIFVYGGAWGSGDKNMYGPLCVENMECSVKTIK
jgi:acetyl esterase/lipase